MEQHGNLFPNTFKQGLAYLQFRSVLWLIGQVSDHTSNLQEVVLLLIVVIGRVGDWTYINTE